MADSKISALPASAGLVGTDLFAVVDDPAGTPATQRATISQLSAVLLPLSGGTLTGTLNFLPAVNTKAIHVQSQSLTGSSGENTILASVTWNTTAAPTAIFLGVTDTNSHADARLLDLVVGGFSKFFVKKNGDIGWAGEATGGFGDIVANSVMSNTEVQATGNISSGATLSGSAVNTVDLTVSGTTQLGAGGAVFSVDPSGNVGFFNAPPAGQQASAVLTNDVASGGSDDIIDNYTDLTTYSADALTIRNNIYQLARKVKELSDALHTFGLLAS